MILNHFMKKLLFLLSLSVFLPFSANAQCNIRSSAVTDLNDLYNYTHADLSYPKLKIDNGNLKAVADTEETTYGITNQTKKYYLGAYTEGNKITIYSKIFKLHFKCDEYVKSKLRGMLTHEYTHYLDSYGVLSNLIHTDNDEETAIISEHVLSRLVFGNEVVQFTRPLTADETNKANLLRNFYIKNSKKG